MDRGEAMQSCQSNVVEYQSLCLDDGDYVGRNVRELPSV